MKQNRPLGVYRRAGVDKDETTRRRIAELQNRINDGISSFDRNIAEGARSVAATPAELKGMPQDWLAAHPAGADGQVRISMAYPDARPVFSCADSAELRQRMASAFGNRAYPANDSRFWQLVDDRPRFALLARHPPPGALDLRHHNAGHAREVNGLT